MNDLATSPARWTVDPGHSTVGFSVRHLMIAHVRGAFARFTGEATYDPARPEATRITATVDVGSIDTRHPQRDADLRGELFFDAERHPAMTFASTSARRVGDGLAVTGDLTIRGVTREATLAVSEVAGPAVDLRGGVRLGATATTTVRRSDFGMVWNKALEAGGVVIGDAIAITLDLELVRAT